ncbi:hypothetical protein ACFWP2_37860 [Kitasatospora sp. NPDC058444]|uniref:hypothetical protein n=1 Tax=Kitasatospora sp. NPDC058444 TaxID=3346504 RepID=UPI00364DEFDC
MTTDTADRRPWLRTEHGATIGHTEAWSWGRTVRLQLRRILHEDDGETGIIDARQLVMALRMVLRGAQMTRRHLTTDAGRAILDEGLAAFTAAVPGGKEARDVIEHFDEYTQGTGRLQQPARTGLRLPDEEQAQRFHIDFRRDNGDNGQQRPVLIVGPYPIDLITAAEAANRLECDIYEAVLAEEGRPVPRGWTYAIQGIPAP